MLVSDLGLVHIHEVRFTRGEGLSFEVKLLAWVSLLFLFVVVNSFNEGFSAATYLQVLHTHVNALAHNAASDDPVDGDTNGSYAHVEDAASLAVVALVGHAHGLSRVCLDVHVVAAVEGREVAGDRNCAVAPEPFREKIPSLATLPVAVRHF